MSTALVQRHDRRRFVKAVSAGVGGLILWPACLRAGSRQREAVRFIVISDTHVGYHGQDRAAGLWEKTAAEIADAEGDVVIHLGDIVDGKREDQYPIYLAARRRIGKPVHEVPGNHDPAELFRKHVREKVDTVVDHRWLRFVLVNNTRTDSHDGFLSDEQIEWIDRQCRDAAGRDLLVTLCMHVPVHKNLHPDRGWYVKPEDGQTKLYETIRKHRDRVLALLHGHFHNGIRGWDDHPPVHEICFPSALYNLNRRLEEQGAPGYNPLEFRPGYTLVRVAGTTMQLRYKPLGEEVAVEKSLELLKG